MAGQNLGAQKPERVAQAVRIASTYGVGIAVVVGTLFLLVPEALLAVFGMTDAVSVAIATELMGWLAVSGLFVSTALTYTGGLCGTGDTKGPLYISIISQIVVPLGLLSVLQMQGPLEPVDIWRAIVLGHLTRGALSVLRFRRGARKGIEIGKGVAG